MLISLHGQKGRIEAALWLFKITCQWVSFVPIWNVTNIVIQSSEMYHNPNWKQWCTHSGWLCKTNTHCAWIIAELRRVILQAKMNLGLQLPLPRFFVPELNVYIFIFIFFIIHKSLNHVSTLLCSVKDTQSSETWWKKLRCHLLSSPHSFALFLSAAATILFSPLEGKAKVSCLSHAVLKVLSY